MVSVNEYKVLLELEPRYQADPRALSLLYFKNSNGKLIPLDTMANVVTETGPQTINHYGQLPSATISFNLKPGASLGEVVNRIQTIADASCRSLSAPSSKARPRPSRAPSETCGCC